MTSSVSFTSRLLNYIEPYYIDGIAKTAFYTEVNTNIKKNEKVFINNGYFDSEYYISKGKWVKNADGYRVLVSDKCKLVLDINYNSGIYIGLTGTYKEDIYDNFIKIYNVRSQREFDYINKLFIDSYSQSRYSKFEKGYTNNIIFAESIYFGNGSGIGTNNGIGSSKAFWSRNGYDWVNVTGQFNTNSFTFSSDYYIAGLTNNGRIYIVGEDINYGGKVYKEKNIYRFNGTTSSVNAWEIDTNYKSPILSKLNFKQGVFRGIHNDGIFGSYKKSENWYGTQSKWNSGFFVNSNWNSGFMNSKSVVNDQSFYTNIEAGRPVQTTDFSNNKGNGYNYVVDSNVYSGIIQNGNFINCNIGVKSNGATAIDNYFGYTSSFPISILGGLYNYCDINNTDMDNAYTLDTIVFNSHLKDTKTLNTQLSESYSEGGEFSVNNGIKIISADMYSYIPNYVGSSTTLIENVRGVLKLYISDIDYSRLDTFDNFFITKINKDYIISSLNSDDKILLPYETRYVLDTFWDFKVGGNNQECLAAIRSASDNKFISNVNFDGITYTSELNSNPNSYASIDIDLADYLVFYLQNNSYVYPNQSVIKKSNVQNLFTNTSISNSDFRNGVISGIRWTSGSNVNYPSNIIKYESGKLKITKVSTSEILIYLNESQPTINDNQLRRGSYVWLDSIYHLADDGSYTNISGAYKITNYVGDQITLSNLSIINPILSGGTYSVPDNLPNYVSINKLLIDSSEVKSGLFIRTLLKNSTFYNEEFNNYDRDIVISNIEKLRLVNLLFRDNNNTVKASLVHKSHILNANWISGISNNSIWIGVTFGDGVFNNGIWENGTFNNGYFQNSKFVTYSTVDYSLKTHYKNWFNGTFNGGFFNNSVWLSGTFNNGKLYNSDWYGGIWNNGILGDKNIPTLNTNMSKFPTIEVGATQTFWYNGIVENAQIGGDGIVYWYDGKFNGGVFTSNNTNVYRESIWYNGEFNGGNFTGLARWKDGKFNKGKFSSYYGWTMSSSTYSTDYSWEKGVFNGGQFGIASYLTNSVWYDGEFNGGIFQGRVWNDGIFQNGNFYGGSTYSVVSDEYLFVESYTYSYYGLWRNGWVTNIKHKAVTDELISVNNLRTIEVESPKVVQIENILWIDGNFDHPSGTIEQSAWLSGSFKKGTFKDGLFNPYVNRSHWDSTYGTYSSFNLSISDCIWENGSFDGGAFYISDWYNGNFLNGTMSGSRWIDGIWYYGYAKNIYWENGTWKNGMWDGSPFDYTNLSTQNEMVTGKDRDILLRISNVAIHGNVHLINAFTGSYTDEILLDGNFQNINKFYGWTFSNTGLRNWISVYNGLKLPSSVSSDPQINLVSYFYNQDQYGDPSTYLNTFTYEIGPDVYPGDQYIFYAYGGWVTVVASVGDTDVSIAQKLADKINQGANQYVVQYSQYVSYSPYYITQWGTWRTVAIYNYVYPYPVAIQVSNQFTVTYPSSTWVSISTKSGGYTTGAYDESEILYAMSSGPTTSVFTQSLVNHIISLDISNSGGRTDFVVYIGNTYSVETITGNISKTYKYTYIPPDDGSAVEFGLKRVLYQNPDNSSITITGASIKTIEAVYAREYNNKLYEFATFSEPFTYGLTGSTVSLPTILLPTIVSNRELVSLKFGNGTFKYGVWEGGYWNNGWRSIWTDSDVDYIIFTDIYTGGVVEVSSNLWRIKLIAFNGTNGLNIGDKVSIGNIVCIDVNEDRRLIKSYLRIVDIDDISITVEVSLNMPVRQIIKDSENHMIYVSKTVWLSGVFHNGYFKGIWNYGLFRGYPYISVMDDSHWIDGVFDGGKFHSGKEYYVNRGETFSYNTGLVQNFVFRDNNVAGSGDFLYNSWIDVNYVTYSMSNLFKDNIRYNQKYGISISENNLKGFPSFDILSSESIFRNSFDLNKKSYRLGYKYRKYVDYIANSAYFTYPLNTNGEPGVDEFLENEWLYTNRSMNLHSNAIGGDDNLLVVDYKAESYSNVGIKAVQIDKIQYFQNGDRISGNSPASSPYGTRTRDYSDTSGYNFYINDVLQSPPNPSSTNLRMSNWSVIADSTWKYYTVPILSPRIDIYGASLREYPSTTLFPNLNIDGDTIETIRRTYMMDWISMYSLDTSYGGYDNPGLTSNQYIQFGQTSSTFSGGYSPTFSFWSYKIPRTSTYTINVELPFTFYADETYRISSASKRGGWSVFKFAGVIEKLNGDNPYDESSWSYITSTKLTFYGNSGYWNNGNGYCIDVNTGCVLFDGLPPTLVAKLYISGVNVALEEGDYIRFRLYWTDIRKMFVSDDGSDTKAPGYLNLVIGKDIRHTDYFQNNNGYFEVVDSETFFNTNTNLLDHQETRNIERFRYSMIDFDLYKYEGYPYQGTQSLLPTIFLLNDNPEFVPATFSKTIINHAIDYNPNNVQNKVEYFYNRKSLSIFFTSTEAFDAYFSKIKFYEVDMIPFFKYTEEDTIDQSIKNPYYGVAPYFNSNDSSISIGNQIFTLSFTQSGG